VANKKRKKQRSRQRTSFTPAPPAAASGDAPVFPAAAGMPSSASAAARPSAPAAAPNYASGISGPRRGAGGAVAGAAAIDIDARVPYFSSDLRRVLITAAVMIVLIVGGSLLIK
jgi:hypothetical protein